LSKIRHPLTNAPGTRLLGEMAPKILLVEDESIVRMNLADILRSEGYTVVEAHDGAEAVNLFERQHFDLVITDLVMPELHGFKLIARVRAISPKVPVILITAYLSRQAGKALLEGSSEFIAKPIQPEVLLASVKHLLPTESVYRRKRSSQVWHLCANCSGWPAEDYDEQRVPPIGQLCNECTVKREANDCR
jgi:CheY-like chemotaxis protein